ncbi:hypothetical protein HanRHA438_Chr15g0684621 [Helianthus annuus]|uniref:Uncharacterized protein n=1 Tax=Helianthus annuus TaxID=4232 RepID=A0A251S8N9_HELAN|nr:hypothetical protein HanXRQr2_Chr15g0672301 [Helianthus annuus]KAJ0471457.1 hypothetical protein HanHA89_Chr15g0596421 [Helianthus annuus]KAJ0647075.1 hypothetical protein HanLR1_Chr15g0557981 [Helianthus annuus]KAJ0650978.1 hypothetical protein HanOQP8_Chr15g0556111 [Helianthus annuus]KAJ0842813.1 hypothetical protein HanRHA438_Chr15g0684621 [Helianthus annuus]
MLKCNCTGINYRKPLRAPLRVQVCMLMRACPTLAHFGAPRTSLQCPCSMRECVPPCHVYSHAYAHDCHVMRHWADPPGPRACMPCHQPPGPCISCAPPRACGQKYKGDSQAPRGDASVQSAPSKRLIAHVVRVCKCELGSAPFACTLSVCFHETIRMESCH